MTWLLALLVTVGHASWTHGQNPSSHSSLACVSKSCRDLPTRDILSSEHWLLGRSCLDETDEVGRGNCPVLGQATRFMFEAFTFFFLLFFSFFFLFFFLKGALFKLALCLFCLGKTCSAAFNIKLLLRLYWEKRTCKMYP